MEANRIPKGRGVLNIHEAPERVVRNDCRMVSISVRFAVTVLVSFIPRAARRTTIEETKVRRTGALTSVSAVKERSMPRKAKQLFMKRNRKRRNPSSSQRKRRAGEPLKLSRGLCPFLFPACFFKGIIGKGFIRPANRCLRDSTDNSVQGKEKKYGGSTMHWCNEKGKHFNDHAEGGDYDQMFASNGICQSTRRNFEND